jgi:hypothetical protein
MSEFIIILLVSIGLNASEAQSTVLGGQVYDEIGECHIAGTRFKTPCKNKVKPAENLLGGNRYDEHGNCIATIDKVLFFISKSLVFYHKVLYQYHSLTLVG